MSDSHSRPKPWERGAKSRDFAKAPRALRRVLILSEDEKSSTLYLRKFGLNPREVQIDGTGMNTDSLVKLAIKRKQAAIREKNPYQQIWVVFDRDDFPMWNVGRAHDLARAHPDIRLCPSNECFEVWYLLHFHFFDTPEDRHALCGKISKQIGVPYEKSRDDIYRHLKDHQQTALRNARKLEARNWENYRDHYLNPSTHVHHLVEFLLKFADNG